MRIAEQLQPQPAHNALRCCGRKGPVLGQKACGIQRDGGLPELAGRPQAQAQRQRAAAGALGQLGQRLKARGCVAVVQCPARRPELHALANFLGMPWRGALQRQLQVRLAQRRVLQRLRTFCHQQMRQ